MAKVKMSYKKARMVQRACRVFEEKSLAGYQEVVELIGGDEADVLLSLILRNNWRQANPQMPDAEIQINVLDKLYDAGVLA